MSKPTGKAFIKSILIRNTRKDGFPIYLKNLIFLIASYKLSKKVETQEKFNSELLYMLVKTSIGVCKLDFPAFSGLFDKFTEFKVPKCRDIQGFKKYRKELVKLKESFYILVVDGL